MQEEATSNRKEQHPSIQESVQPSFQAPFPVSEWQGCPLTSNETSPSVINPFQKVPSMGGDLQHNPLLSESP